LSCIVVSALAQLARHRDGAERLAQVVREHGDEALAILGFDLQLALALRELGVQPAGLAERLNPSVQLGLREWQAYEVVGAGEQTLEHDLFSSHRGREQDGQGRTIESRAHEAADLRPGDLGHVPV
jgi:hypothetical protein